MGQANPLLSFDHVTKDFYENVVLQDVCFELERGQILGLVGENGAGKTTLMRILFGMPVIAQTGGYQGRVCIDGQDPDHACAMIHARARPEKAALSAISGASRPLAWSFRTRAPAGRG